MGTRNLTCVFVGGEYKVAQYGQWDGYPSGQGATALEFLQRSNLERFAEKCRAARWATDEEIQATWADFGVPPEATSVDYGIAKKRGQKYPHLSRDTGAGILAIVRDAEPGIALKSEIDFAGDSLMCEWAYVIDLDARTFEVYAGFNRAPPEPGARFASAPTRGGYGPVKLLRSWPLDALPSKKELLALEDVESDEVEP